MEETATSVDGVRPESNLPWRRLHRTIVDPIGDHVQRAPCIPLVTLLPPVERLILFPHGFFLVFQIPSNGWATVDDNEARTLYKARAK